MTAVPEEQERRRKSRSRERTTDATMEPRQPRRLEKKTNMAVQVQILCHGVSRLGSRR
jgi:hypothetical protein